MSIGLPNIKKYYYERMVDFIFRKRPSKDSLLAIIQDGEKGENIGGKKRKKYRFKKKYGGTLTMEKMQKLYKEIS